MNEINRLPSTAPAATCCRQAADAQHEIGAVAPQQQRTDDRYCASTSEGQVLPGIDLIVERKSAPKLNMTPAANANRAPIRRNVRDQICESCRHTDRAGGDDER